MKSADSEFRQSPIGDLDDAGRGVIVATDAAGAGGSQFTATENGAGAGGSQFTATENGAGAGGSQFTATENGADATSCVPPVADATSCVPPAADAPMRRHPSRNSVMTYHDNRSVILYVTVVTEKRKRVLADKAVLDCILAAWKAATDWLVGWYVIMPDHIHFFCSPATYPPSDFHRWMKRWKSLASIAYRKLRELEGRSLLRPKNTGEADATSCVPPARNPPLFQRDCWDRQLRTGESYAQKWEYVRNNPVRKRLVANTDDWPYQGRVNVLEWHERI